MFVFLGDIGILGMAGKSVMLSILICIIILGCIFVVFSGYC